MAPNSSGRKWAFLVIPENYPKNGKKNTMRGRPWHEVKEKNTNTACFFTKRN